MNDAVDVRANKRNLRSQMRRQVLARQAVAERSARIFERIEAMPEWRNARSVLWYIDLPGEVSTQPYLARELMGSRRCAVTWCEVHELKLAWLKSMSELAPRTLGILEPIDAIREDSSRWLNISEIDLVLVPGLAFDRSGYRVGHGKGYYDKLLAAAPESTARVALAFDEQVLDAVPREPHDVMMHYVVTDRMTYRFGPSAT